MDVRSVLLHRALCLEGPRARFNVSLKSETIFEEGAWHFHFILSLTNCVTIPGCRKYHLLRPIGVF